MIYKKRKPFFQLSSYEKKLLLLNFNYSLQFSSLSYIYRNLKKIFLINYFVMWVKNVLQVKTFFHFMVNEKACYKQKLCVELIEGFYCVVYWMSSVQLLDPTVLWIPSILQYCLKNFIAKCNTARNIFWILIRVFGISLRDVNDK